MFIKSLLFLLLCCSPTLAANYYVSTSGSGTSCTLGSPCLLATAAVGLGPATGGDTYFLRVGTYNNKYDFTLSGSAGSKITFRSYPGETAVIDGYVTTTLNGAITNSQTTCMLTDGSKFPAGSFVEIDQEILFIETKGSVNAVTLLNRAQGGTDGGAASHSNGATVRLAVNPQIKVTGNYLAFRDLEVMSSDPVRVYNRTLSDPSTHRGQGFQVLGSNIDIINNTIHDNRDGIYGQSNAANVRTAGNVFYNNGIIDSVRGHGQTIYLQNDGTGTKTVYGNVSTNGFAEGMEAFGQSGPVQKITFDSNISFNAGSPNQWVGNPSGYALNNGAANIFTGSSLMAQDQMTITNNMTYHRLGITGGNIFLGSGEDNLGLTVTNNYALGGMTGLLLNRWSTVTATGNTSWCNGTNGAGNASAIEDIQVASPGTWTVDNNTYYTSVTNSTSVFKWNSSGYVDFGAYKAASGKEASSTATTSAPTGIAIKYVPNADVDANSRIAGMIGVFNPSGSGTVNVTLSSAGLTVGQGYAIYAADSMGGAAVLSGTYAGGTVALPMTTTAITAPIGNPHTPDSCRPVFGAFVVLSSAAPPTPPTISLTLSATSRQIVISYTAPNFTPCTVEVSESAAYMPLVNDVNSALFTGANLDNRIGTLGTGTTARQFIAGTLQQPNGTISNLALDGKRYSRTLQVNTPHYIRVTCGTSVGTGSIATRNIPLGKTYAEPLPVASAGNYAWPTTNDANRLETMTDPVYGTLLRKISKATEDLSVADGGGQIRCADPTFNDSSGVPGWLCIFPTNSGSAYLYWIGVTTGESRWLGVPRMSSGVLPDMPTTYFTAGATSKFDPLGRLYQLGLDGSGEPHVLRCTMPASGNSAYDADLSSGVDAPCTFADLTPNPNNLAVLNLTFDATFDKTKFFNYYRQSVGGNYLAYNVIRGIQDSYGWVGMVNVSANPITAVSALMPLWKRGSAAVGTSYRWCGIHGSGNSPESGPVIALTPKTLYAGGGPGLGPYTVTLGASMTLSQTTITLSSNTPTSPNADTTLYAIQAGDEIGIPNDATGEHMTLGSFVSGTTWNVTRGIANPQTAHTIGDIVNMACTSHRAGGVGEGVTDLWNAAADPTGSDTTDTNLVRYFDGFSGHGGRGLGRWISEAGYSGCSGLASFMAPCAASFIINDSPTFAGAFKTAAGCTYQKHPGPPQQSLAPPGDQVWGVDGFVNDCDTTDSPPTSFTNITGSLWKFFNSNYTISRKKLPMLAIIGGAHPLLDISSAATGNTIDGTAGFNYKYCIANAVNECRTGSSIGDIYVNGPGLSGGSYCGTGNLSLSDTNSICLSNVPAWGQTITQIGIFSADPTGKYVRSLSSGMAGMKTSGTNVANMTPDGKWIWFPRDTSGTRIGYLIKTPPWPGYDGIDRNTFQLRTAAVAGPSNTVTAIMEFGYDTSFNCTSRNEPCALATSNAPYFFETSDTYTRLSCPSGVCTFSIPVLPDHVVYARAKYYDESGSLIATGATFALTDNGAVPPPPAVSVCNWNTSPACQ